MKNGNFEARRHRKWRPITARPVTVTRAMLVRAFSAPDRSRKDVLAIVSQYMGDGPVPPSWGRLGVRGTFGSKVERLWARHIKGLRLATYREGGRNLTPVIQTVYDFGATPEDLHKMTDGSPADIGGMVLSDLKAMVRSTHAPGEAAPKNFPVFMDEWSCYAELPAATLIGSGDDHEAVRVTFTQPAV